MKALVLTSTFRRHVFVANEIASGCDVVGVWQEAKTFVPERYAADAAEEAIIRSHFDARDEAEARYFAGHGALRLSPAAAHRLVEGGGCSLPSEVELMKALGPEVVLVFGTGLLKAPLLEAFAGRVINIHLGLSPYYRGAGTNFWPLVNREPEYVGATIHYLDAGIDTGPILAHARPELFPGDGPHDIGNRAIAAAVQTAVAAARAHVSGRVRPVRQTGAGRLYQRKNFSAAAVRRLYQNFESGMIAEYLAARASRDARLSLVGLGSAA